MNRITTRGTRSAGFTLMELLIVVIIIGILSTLAVPQFTKYVAQSKEADAVNAISTMLTGEALYYAEQSKFTTVITDLTVQPAASRYWIPGAMSTTADADLLLGAPQVNVIYTDKTDATHMVKGGVDSTGKKTLMYKRSGQTAYTAF